MNESELVDVRLWHENGPVCKCAWPVGLPRNFDELHRDFGIFIEKKITSYNKVQRNFEDLHQEIWCKIIGSDLLNKFVSRTARSLPNVFFAHEAAALMGLTFNEFQIALYHKSHVHLDFMPRDGKMVLDHNRGYAVVDPKATFDSGDIQALDEIYPDKARSQPRMIAWPLQSMGFKAYLTQAIHNHFANWCRTRKRKYQDILLPGTATLQTTDTGYAHVGQNFEATDWESRLVSMAMTDEDMLTVVEAVELEFAAAGMDVRTVTETETYVGADDKVHERPTPAAARSLELLDALAEGRVAHPTPQRKPKAHRATGFRQARHEATNFGDGKTIREVVRVQQRSEIRARVRLAD